MNAFIIAWSWELWAATRSSAWELSNSYSILPSGGRSRGLRFSGHSSGRLALHMRHLPHGPGMFWRFSSALPGRPVHAAVGRQMVESSGSCHSSHESRYVDTWRSALLRSPIRVMTLRWRLLYLRQSRSTSAFAVEGIPRAAASLACLCTESTPVSAISSARISRIRPSTASRFLRAASRSSRNTPLLVHFA